MSAAVAIPTVRMLPVFRCRVLSARLTVANCSTMWTQGSKLTATSKGAPGVQTLTHAAYLSTSRCTGCEVGKAHAAGAQPAQWPDGAPLERLELAVPIAHRDVKPSKVIKRSSAASQAAPRRAPLSTETPAEMPPAAPLRAAEEVPVPKSNKYKIDGQELTASELLARKDAGGITPDALTMRIRGGWDVGDAYRLPAGSRRPTAATKRARKPASSAPASRARSPKPPPSPSTLSAAVGDATRAVDPIELLTRLGFRVEALGAFPRGRGFLLLEENAAT